MPKNPVIPPQKVFDKIGRLPFWDDNGKLKNKGDSVWREASELLDKKMSISYLYIYISNNRHNVVNKIVEQYWVDVNEQSNKSNSLNGTDDSNWSTHDSGGRLPFKSLRSTLTIPENVWKTIEPRLVQYDGEAKYKLQSGLTDILYEAIWRDLKLPCPFSFRSETLSMSEGSFLTIHAYCNECGNVFNAYAIQPPDPNSDLTLHVSTYDTRRIIHAKKRQLKGSQRKVVGQQLAAGTSTYALRRKTASRTMDFGDPEPANLYRENVYRKTKQQYVDDELGVKGLVDPILSIQKLKYDPRYAGFIREIGLDKFYVIYFSEDQTFLYKR